MFEVTYKKQAEKMLLKLPDHLKKRIRQKMAIIAQDPFGQHNNVTKLKDRPGYRLRVGDWRVIYRIIDDQVCILVVKIAPRGSVYR
ncbi:type II toxin-antitoxin system RelE family toxin [Candidatus Leptofilum sp.]|uniref:type II toxin-antitoxin system RelE family toxin n=1 Tax=Candidatus Leptofilum sp. TaxID=3241576 RepID=UPI003B591C58